MPDYDNNVYYNPDKAGLSVVGEVEYSSGNWEFDTRVVWFHEASKRLLTARDSGCSCPTPFEDFTLEALEDITHHFAAFLVDEYRGEQKYGLATREKVDTLVSKCAAILTPKAAF